MNCLTVEIDEKSSNLLELAANNDVEAFRRSIEQEPFAIDEVGLWYGRRKGSNRMVLEHRTPLMVASTYGSVDVLKFIVSLPSVDINRATDPDRTTALHCAASGGSFDAVDAVKILLAAGADSTSLDAHGNRPADVVVAPPKLADAKDALEQLLGGSTNFMDGEDHRALPICMATASASLNPESSALSLSPDDDASLLSNSISSPSPSMPKFPELPRVAISEKKEYPVDPSLPDIKNSIYATDDFRMFSFKIRPCSRAYSHDWTECPFVHPGENARRRDPRKYHYSCVPCPEFRKGACRRGDMCDYAHGVFECWLHPAQYRTRLCKDGTSCARRVCFFAHTNEELRPLYMSTGSAVPSPRSSSSAAMEMAAALGLVPGSPSSVSAVMPPFTPPISPSANNGNSHSTPGWPQPNVPILNLPASNIQSSRLRSSLSARDMPVEDLPEFDTQQLLNDACFSRLNSLAGNRSVRTKALTPSNLDELFSAEIASSPRFSSEQGAIFSPSHRAAILNQFQQQQHSLLSPINTSVFSPRTADAQHLPVHSSLLQAARSASSPGFMSPRGAEPPSPMSTHLAMLSQWERQQQTLRSQSSRDLAPISSPIVGSPVSSSRAKWASPSGAPDWGVNGDELGPLKGLSSSEMHGNLDEPDLSWVHSLVKESPPEKLVSSTVASSAYAIGTECSSSNNMTEGHDQAAVLSAWLEQMQLDQVTS